MEIRDLKRILNLFGICVEGIGLMSILGGVLLLITFWNIDHLPRLKVGKRYGVYRSVWQ